MNTEKMVTVPESLLDAASSSLVAAQVYLAALRVIAGIEVESAEAKKLQLLAIEAIKKAEDDQALSQQVF